MERAQRFWAKDLCNIRAKPPLYNQTVQPVFQEALFPGNMGPFFGIDRHVTHQDNIMKLNPD
jgi:hypothetical protein